MARTRENRHIRLRQYLLDHLAECQQRAVLQTFCHIDDDLTVIDIIVDPLRRRPNIGGRYRKNDDISVLAGIFQITLDLDRIRQNHTGQSIPVLTIFPKHRELILHR